MSALAYIHDRGADFAAGIRVIDPPSYKPTPSATRSPDSDDQHPATDPAFFARAHLDAPDLREPADEKALRHEQRERHAEFCVDHPSGS